MPHKASTFWVRLRLGTRLGTLEAKVTFGEGRQPALGLVTPDTPGWNFSSGAHATELAEEALPRLQALLPINHVQLDVIEES